MDELLRDLMKEKNKNNSLAIVEILGKIQKRTFFMMGPLSKVLLKLENAKKPEALPLSLDWILSNSKNKPFIYLTQQVIQFRTIKGTTFFQACALDRRKMHAKE